MVPAEVYERVFQLWADNRTGTCFVLDVEGRQYVITAKHLVDGVDPSMVAITQDGKQRSLEVTSVWQSPVADVAVLTAGRLLAPPNLILPATKEGMVYGQDAHFLGFPYGLTWSPRVLLHLGQPLPLVKRATVSGEIALSPNHDVLLLDGHNNEGFSGGPVVLVPPGKRKVQVVGVVSGYRAQQTPIRDPQGATVAEIAINTGLMLAESIDQALLGVRILGVGFAIPDETR